MPSASPREAGADFVGGDDLIQRIDKEDLPRLRCRDRDARYDGRRSAGLGRILGRRGLMPNPKSGTVVQADDLPRVLGEVRRGQVEFRNDKTGLLHVAIGKVSFSADQIRDNFAALMDAVKAAKPSGTKGVYIKSVTLTSTMGPGIPVDIAAAQTMTRPQAISAFSNAVESDGSPFIARDSRRSTELNGHQPPAEASRSAPP